MIGREPHPTTHADINLDRLTTEEYDALHELVHEQASVLASNAINSGEAIDFLLGNGWTKDDIRTRLNEMTFATWSDEDVADHVLGSGAATYSWWRTLKRLPDGTYHARLENPDHGEETVSTTFTADDVRRVRGEILAGQHGVNDTIIGALRDDPDAGAVDCLLQILILGEATYS